MADFDFDTWWLENVGPKDNVMDMVYKKITQDAIEAVLKFYNLNIEKKKKVTQPKEIKVNKEEMEVIA